MESFERVKKIRKILCAVDGSNYSLNAGLQSVELAKSLAAELTLIHIASYPSHHYGISKHTILAGLPVEDHEKDRMKESAYHLMEKISNVAKELDLPVKSEVLATETNIVDEIIIYSSRNNIDLIVVGTRGLNQFQTSYVGSTSAQLVEKANCCVLVVR